MKQLSDIFHQLAPLSAAVSRKPSRQGERKLPRRGTRPPSRRSAANAPCMVIGIGAARREALTTFFENMPANSGMAFVLVEPLAQHCEGSLVDLLGRHTAMVVLDARDRMRLAANRVFVVPANLVATVHDSVLLLSKRVPVRRNPKPIDACFVSLAKDQRERAACILLSGTGSDGIRGVRKIGERRGLALVEAAPAAVAASELVDHCVEAADMPRLLMNYRQQLQKVAAPHVLTSEVHALERELHATQVRLRATIDALSASNEELQAVNEEYQSINEELHAANAELESAKEEMYSVNEELRAANAEMSSKNDLLTRLNDDLKNLLDETQIATIFLDDELNITYFTPAMTDLFNLRHGDHGRPITDLATRLRYADLQRDAAEVMCKLGTIEREVRTDTEAVFLMRIHPYRSMHGVIDGVVITFIDITDRKRHEAAQAQIAAIVDCSQDAIIGHTLDGTITSWNAGAQAIFGYTAAEAIGKPFAILIPEDQGEQAQQVLDRLQQGERVEHFEVDRIRKDGRIIDVSLSVSPVKDPEGKLIAASTIAREFTQRKLVEDHKSMLMRELDHRIQNTLAVVSSLVRQTVRNSDSLEAFARDIEGRLGAFSRVQALSNHERQGRAALRDIVLGELHPYELREQHRIVVGAGTDIVLTPTATQALALALHELATNAAKYGALSVPAGRVEVTWRVEDPAREPRVLIDWTESDGPPVRPPARRGFGTQLIEDMVSFALNAKVRRDFRPEGVRCNIEFPLAAAGDAQGAELATK